MSLSRALSLLSLSLLTTFAGAEPPRERIKVEIAPEIMAGLSPEQKQDVQKLLDVLEPHLYTWTQLPIELPESALLDGTRFINISDLIPPPAPEDVRKLGGDVRLNEDQLAQVHETGTFTVPSEDYPGRVHVWKYHTWLQKGAESIRLQVAKDQKSAQDQIAVEIPARLFGDDLMSVRRGVHNIRFALREVADVLVGLKNTRTEHDEIHTQRDAEIEKTFGLGDRDFIERVRTTLDRVFAASESKWLNQLDDVIVKAKAKLAPTDSPDEWTARLTELVAREKQDFFYVQTENAPELEAIQPGLGQFLVRQGRAFEIIRAAEAKFGQAAQVEAELSMDAFKANHAWQAASAKKVARLGERAAQAFRTAHQWENYESIAAELDAANLNAEANTLRRQTEIYRASESVGYASLREVPQRTFLYPMQIYQQSLWTTKHLSTGGWTIKQSYDLTSDTSGKGWRFKNILLRTVAGWNQGLYALFVKDLWNGPLGIRSLTTQNPFPVLFRAVHDRESGSDAEGTIVADTSYLRKTMHSRAQEGIAEGNRILENFANQSDFAFGREVEKIIVAVRAKFFYKMVWPAAFYVGQPTLTAANVLLSGTLGTGLVLVGTPFLSVGVYLGQALIFDSAGVGRAPVKLEQSVVTAALGAGESVLAASATVFHLGGAAILSGKGYVQGQIRTAWDALWLKVIQAQANVPQRDHAGIVRRIKGPGLDAEFYFSLSPILVQGVLLGELERRQFNAHADALTALIQKPAQDAAVALAPFRAVVGEVPQRAEPPPALKTINARQMKWQSELNTLIKKRAEKFNTQLRVPQPSRNHIRFAQADWLTLLRDSTVLVESFTKQKIFTKMSAPQIAKFWRSADLDAGDWSGLARKMLAEQFGEAILVPLDPADDSFEIAVHNPDLESSVAGLLQGEVPADESVRLKLPIQTVRDYHGNPPLLINSNDMCSRLLIRPTL